ncbi:MAG: hypothetical protein SO072_01865 [Dysosmobacter sp.]|nr:hypothetical protein [Dysosmobacter sp.]
MAEKEEYNSTHDGQTIDAAVNQAKPGGTLDSRLRLSLYTSLEQIGVTVGSETMEAIALSLPNNAILEASCGGDNNGAADGSVFPVVSGAALTSGILRVSRIGSYDRVSFEFQAKETASRMFVGFYSSTDGWSGWKKVYTESSKPTAAELNAANLVHASRHKRGGEDSLSFADVASLGLNPVTSPSDDTTQKWVALGSVYCCYTVASQLNDQPSQYGVLFNITYGSEVFQIWRCQPGGPTYWRSGNAGGWSGTWAKAYDSNVVPTFTQFSVGSYEGAGGATSGYAPTLTFPFAPKAVLVVCVKGGAIGNVGYFIKGVSGVVSRVTTNSIDYVNPTVEWGDSSLHYYTTNSYGSTYALNVSGATYGYIAWG